MDQELVGQTVDTAVGHLGAPGRRCDRGLDRRTLDLGCSAQGHRARSSALEPIRIVTRDALGDLVVRTALGVACASLLACGGPAPEEQLEAATERVAQAERGVEQARAAVEREEDDLEKAQAELAAAVEALGEAEERLAEAKSELALVADDTYLFRAVQSALLAEPALEGLAISARVQDRVVTLEGSAPTLELRKKAGAVAEATLGVERVDNDVTVEPPQATSP